jgi:multiple sugar transport system permease protein
VMVGKLRKFKSNLLVYSLIAPALILIVVLDLVPLVQGFVVSFQRQELMKPDAFGWIGFGNFYEALFEEQVFWSSLLRTVLWMVGAVGSAYVVGFCLALLLNRPDIKARGILRALFLIPWVVPDVVTSLIWKWMYNDQFGLINFGLKQLGLVQEPVLFLADPNLAMISVIAVQVWKLYPLMTVMLLAALQQIPGDLYESARIDGSSALQRIWYITLPMIKPTSIVMTLLMSIWTFNHFDIVYLLTGGGPASATMVLSTLVYNKAFFALNLGYATSIGVLMLLTLSILGVPYLRLYRRLDE